MHVVLRLSGLHRAQAVSAQGVLQNLRLPTGDLPHVPGSYSDNREVIGGREKVD